MNIGTAYLEILSDKIVISGEISFTTVLEIREQAEAIFRDRARAVCVFDFAKVAYCDSACLSLLLVWLRQAKAMKKQIQFENLPQPLLNMAKLCGIFDLIRSNHC